MKKPYLMLASFCLVAASAGQAVADPLTLDVLNPFAGSFKGVAGNPKNCPPKFILKLISGETAEVFNGVYQEPLVLTSEMLGENGKLFTSTSEDGKTEVARMKLVVIENRTLLIQVGRGETGKFEEALRISIKDNTITASQGLSHACSFDRE